MPTTFIQDQLATGATQSITGVFVSAMATDGGREHAARRRTTSQVALCAYYLPGRPGAHHGAGGRPGTFNFQLAIPPAPNITGVSARRRAALA